MASKNKGNNNEVTIIRVKDWPWLKAAMAGESRLVCSMLWKGGGAGGEDMPARMQGRQLKKSTQQRGQDIDMASVSDFVATVAV